MLLRNPVFGIRTVFVTSLVMLQVQHVRNIESHFLSSQECIMAGHFQNLHPNPCRFSPSGFFGSKFATVCVTGETLNHTLSCLYIILS